MTVSMIPCHHFQVRAAPGIKDYTNLKVILTWSYRNVIAIANFYSQLDI